MTKALYAEGKCKHFNGTINKVCEAGVAYDNVRNEQGTFDQRNLFPCFCEDLVCDKRELPTAEEIAEGKDFIDSILNGVLVAREAIVVVLEDNGVIGEFAQGSLACPICGDGMLHYTYHGHYNGHIHAECTTESCVRWIE